MKCKKIYIEKMLGMKNHFDISDSIEICEVDIAGVACIGMKTAFTTGMLLQSIEPNELTRLAKTDRYVSDYHEVVT